MRCLVVVFALAACGKSDSKPPPKADDISELGGWVRELDGAPVARRHGETFPLAVGTKVAADSVIDTGPEGRVVIELAQNHARWELGPNQQQKVSDSILWKVAPGTATNVTIRDVGGPSPPPDPHAEENAKAARAAIEARRPDFVKCLGEASKMSIIVDTGPNGLAGFQVKGATKEAADCVAKIMSTIEMPKRAAHVAVRITK
jgi:hypothetical protein